MLRTLFLCLLLAALPATATVDLTSLSLEELMEVEVSLVSRNEQPLFETAAAVAVLTGAEIKRSGVTSLPEALRLIPGMNVGRLDGNKWAVSSRGFADRFSQKLLVLIDGRSVYSPVFGGVYWEYHDLVLEDIERIEVIRGPGATLWGANAMNGIVNIITRSASQTPGGLLAISGGTEERGAVAARYGGSFGEAGAFRVYGKGFDRDAFVGADGRRANDASRMGRGGFRTDWERGPNQFMTQGAVYTGRVGQIFRFPIPQAPWLRQQEDDADLSGGHVMARWQHAETERSDWRLQLYHDRAFSDNVVGSAERSTWDADYQHRIDWGERQETTWGWGYRSARVDVRGTPEKVLFLPQERRTDLWSTFLQHRVQLTPRIHMSLGTKIEHNDFTGVEVQPSFRTLWRISERQAVWAAATRAVRTPSIADDGVRIFFRTFPVSAAIPGITGDQPAVKTYIVGDRAFESEVLHALEAGYRRQLSDQVLVDVTSFYNHYADLRAGEHRPPVPRLVEDDSTPYYRDEVLAVNGMEGTAWGGEVALEWALPEDWGRVRTSYATTRIDLNVDPGLEPTSDAVEGGTPAHQVLLWASLNPWTNVQMDAILRFVDEISDRPDGAAPLLYDDYLPHRDIPAYTQLDMRIEWRVSSELRLSLVGQNLLDDHHPESADLLMDTGPTEAQRGVYSSLIWSF
ncbi:MAG: TonB-dependent receptor [Gemmatimonadetes bacterium]|jgi:iron complex outermembrane recepter protein|nr:TonB-dependent receptor [Gemmatimonadota bacterium]MBT6147690.1 TonB-dependent receptor [Gemmatimonadota bacterium]MBT7863716.1 TonB-dependent receptor [Gemmatimonadota bacterium]